MKNIPFALCLDIGTGDYWFYPSWTHYPPQGDLVIRDVAMGQEILEIIPPFTWPTGAGNADGLQFLAALLTPDWNDMLGEFGSVQFSYGE